MKARILITGNNPQAIAATIKGDGPHRVTNTGSVLIPFNKFKAAQRELWRLHDDLSLEGTFHVWTPKCDELIAESFHLSILRP